MRLARTPAVLLLVLAGPLVPISAATAASGPALTVDAASGRHPISPDIYGMNWADPALAAELRLGTVRWGGNDTTRYNRQNGVWNLAADWYFENYPADENADDFIRANRAAGVSTYLTVPTMGWIAKDPTATGHPLDCGFKTSAYGAQQSTDPYDPPCGNGVRPDGSTLVTGNKPADTSVAVDSTYDGQWVSSLVSQFGPAASGGVRTYGLDNEPVLWSDTHRDVHPSPTTYDELRDKDVAAAAAIKAADPTALVAGPADWGWSAYFDTQAPGDKAAHGNVDLAPWYLAQMKAYADAHSGQRILDVFDEHYYPQADGVTLAAAGDAATQARRLRSTRSLWDPSYTDESWIGTDVDLIPRMKAWVASAYPGTKIGIGEYNWGGLESMNGALAQADVLGIFAREQVDMAMLWDPPTSSQPGAFAFRMYRDYDGFGGSFGDVSVGSTSADQGQLAVYGAQRSSDGALTVMVINKTGGDLSSSLSLSNFPTAAGASAKVYRYSGANLGAIVRGADQALSAPATYPANSITLLVIPRGGARPHPVADFTGDGRADVAVFRPSTGQWYVKGGSPEVTSWGQTGDVAVAGDYDGNGTSDDAVYRPSTGTWYIRGPGSTSSAVVWGQSGDVPVPGDYDGDGTTDVAVYRPSTGTWYLRNGQVAVQWGTSGDVPVPGDYNGDGVTDIAVYRPSTGTWYIRTGPWSATAVAWGASGDVPVPGDYDGNGTTDVAVFRPSTGTWYLRTGPSPVALAWGTSGDVPVVGDYDGNGTADVAVFRPSTSQWFVRAATPFAAAYGASGDQPL